MNSRRPGGFALPTVLIASIVMLTVLLVSVSSTAAIRASIKAQYYNQLSQMAGDAGAVYAKACLIASNGVPQWTDEKPLKPDTDCLGDPLPSCPAIPADAACHYVTVNDSFSTIFTVSLPELSASGKAINVNSVGSTNLFRSSDGSAWRTYNQSARISRSAEPPLQWKQIAGGYNHTCVIGNDDKAYCWGENTNGQLGNNSTTKSMVPVAVDTSGVLSGKTIKSITAGESHTCVIASDNLAYCWGYNSSGRLGNNSTNQSLVPAAVNMANGVSAMYGKTVLYISAGAAHTCAIGSDNQAYCWGAGLNGRLGTNSESDKLVPTAIDMLGFLAGKTMKAISSGGQHTCVIASDNLAYCWGYGFFGALGYNSTTNYWYAVPVVTTGVLSGLTIKSITSSKNHTCVIASNNQAYCWGDDVFGQLGNSLNVKSLVAVAVNTAGVLAGKTIKSVSAVNDHTCVIASDNQAYCWGDNFFGQIGNNSVTGSLVPVAVIASGVMNGKTASSIASSKFHTCAIASDNQAYCWGDNFFGNLGNNNGEIDSLVPVAVVTAGASSNQTFQSISAGANYACSIASDNQAYCWGAGSYGQLGDGLGIDTKVPVAVNVSRTSALYGKSLKSISAGWYHTCAIASDNLAYCWGRNNNGQLGDNTSGTNRLAPVAVNMDNGVSALYGKTVRSISAGKFFTCAIASDNLAYCWGNNANGQLGDNTSGTNRLAPVAVNMANGVSALYGKTVKSIAAGGDHACVIASDNLAYCWGYNFDGELGDNTSGTNRLVPVAVNMANGVSALYGKTVRSISAGAYHTCAVASDNLAYCWGYGGNGELGNNTSTWSIVPVAVNMANGVSALYGKTVVDIVTSNRHTCAIASDNLGYCWGINDNGKLGDNSVVQKLVPVAVNMTNGVSALYGKTINSITASYYNSCTIASDRRTYCWGGNTKGQLGNNSEAQSLVPVASSLAPTFAPVYYSF